jgi:hypothetical protein
VTFTLLDYPGTAFNFPSSEADPEASMGSFNKRLYYALLMFLMCIAPLTLFLGVWSLDTRAKVSAFAREGIAAQGVVLDKAWSYRASTASHNVQVRFVDVDGVERTSWTQIHPLSYERLSVRGPVKVTYLRSRPQTFYLADDAPTSGKATGFIYGAIGCGVITVILSVAVFRLRRELRTARA